MNVNIQIIAKHTHTSLKRPYDFVINPEDGALKEFCVYCQTPLSKEEKWMEKSLLQAMRISLFLHKKVRLINCARCDQAPCTDRIKKWLKRQGPLLIKAAPPATKTGPSLGKEKACF